MEYGGGTHAQSKSDLSKPALSVEAALGLRVSPRLFGRLEEMSVLTEAYARVGATSVSEVVLISGAPGIGKSALVRRFQSLLRVGRHRFARGKCAQLQQGVAFAPLLHALGALIDDVLAQSDETLNAVRDSLGKSIAGQARVITDLLPGAELLVGRGHPLPDLPVALAQARMQRCVLAAFAAFATAGQPLIVFVDDVQWADAATQGLMSAFVAEPPANVLLVVSCRDEAVERLDASDGLIATFRHAPTRLSEITLLPLDFPATRELLASALGETESKVEALALAIQDQAQGNPFFIEHFLRRLREENILARGEMDGQWRWDPARLAQVTGGGDVLDFIAGRLERLDDAEQELMAAIARLGGNADLRLLALLLALPATRVERLAQGLAQIGLLIAQEASFAFPHDRVLEAALLLRRHDGRGLSHARIARLQLVCGGGQRPEQLVKIATHLLRAVENGEIARLKPGPRMRFASVLHAAALQARSTASSEQAAAFLDAAIGLLSARDWDGHRDLAFGITHLWCESLLQRGRIVEADRALATLLERPLPDRGRALAYRLLAALRTLQSDYEGATQAALSGLTLMGHPLKPSPSFEECRAESERILALMGARPDERIADLPLADDPDLALTTSLLSALLVCIFSGDGLRFLHLAKIVELTVTRGITEDSAYGMAWYGVLISDFFGRYEDGFAYGQAALLLIDRHGFEGQRTGALVAVDQLSPWTRSFDYALARVHDAIAAADAAGDLAMTCFARNHLVSNLIQMGRPLVQVMAEAEKGIALTRRIEFRDIEILICAQWRLAHVLKAGALQNPQEEPGDISSASTRFLVLLYEGIGAYLFGDHARAARAFAGAKPLTWSMAAHIDLAYYAFFAALNAAQQGPADQALSAMAEHHARLVQWAPLNPPIFGHKLLLVDAEMARLRGESLVAIQLFDRAILAARSFVHERALARELAGRHCDAQGLDGLAQRYYDEAASDYHLWGAEAKSRLLPRKVADVAQHLSAQDLLGAMRTVRRITLQVDLDPMRQAVLCALMEHIEADRGQLLLIHDGDPVIEAMGYREGSDIRTTLGTVMPTPGRVVSEILERTVKGLEPVLTDVAARPDDPIAVNGLCAIICLPLMSEGRLVAVAYLEANPEHAEHRQSLLPVVSLIAEQAAICLERAAWHARTFENYERRSQAESALRDARAELAQTSHLATMGGMAASIAHEINQPLTSIIANAAASARWLKHAEPKVQEALLNLKRITTSGKRAVEIITALRSLAKQDNIQREPVDLKAVISTVLELTEPDIATHGVRVVVEIEQDRCMVLGDRVQLQQLILNLVKNAIEAMSQTAQDDRVLSVTCLRNEEIWLTRIEDHGCGIAEDALAKIFTPLFTTKAKGMGMGLAICSSIVTAHRGKMAAGAGGAGGTYFEFTLPVH
jgi:predicted ATPase/signal transduction histidine kinase